MFRVGRLFVSVSSDPPKGPQWPPLSSLHFTIQPRDRVGHPPEMDAQMMAHHWRGHLGACVSGVFVMQAVRPPGLLHPLSIMHPLFAQK